MKNLTPFTQNLTPFTQNLTPFTPSEVLRTYGTLRHATRAYSVARAAVLIRGYNVGYKCGL